MHFSRNCSISQPSLSISDLLVTNILYNITYYLNVQNISKNLKLELKTFLVDYMPADSSTADLEFSILRNRILNFSKEHMKSTKVWSAGVSDYGPLGFANVTKECSF